MIPDSLYGRPFSEWRELNNVLKKHDIDSARELNEALKKRCDKERVEVFCRLNQKRLLGTMPRLRMPVAHTHIRLATMGKIAGVSACSPSDRCEAIETVTLIAEVVRGEDVLDVKGILVTDAPLKTLMQLRDFRLPGESKDAADMRQYMS